MTMTMLDVRHLVGFHGLKQVLFDVSLYVGGGGEAVALLGRNGMGKTMTINSIMGLVQPRGGKILFCGEDITGLPAHRVARCGVGLVPEGRQIFHNLTLEENLLVTATTGCSGQSMPWTLRRIYDMFPSLHARRRCMGGLLSGGEQQMLAIGRALMTNPRLLILDEATEGLSPLVRQEIWACLARLKADGVSVLIVDRHIAALCLIADRHYILEKGAVVWQGSTAEMNADPELRSRYLAV